eukprot:10305318-Alexandrium_andersonii.AAC.1
MTQPAPALDAWGSSPRAPTAMTAGGARRHPTPSLDAPVSAGRSRSLLPPGDRVPRARVRLPRPEAGRAPEPLPCLFLG